MTTDLRPLRPGVVVPVAGIAQNQTQAREVHIGDEVTLAHELSNPFDTFAVRIEDTEGNLLGYVPRRGELNQRLVLGHEGGLWSGVVVDKYDSETVGLRVQINALLGRRDPAYGSDAPGIRSRDIDDQAEVPDGPQGTAADAHAMGEPETVPQVYSRSGRLLGTLLGTAGSKTRVRTAAGAVVAYPTSIVETRLLPKTA